MPRYVLDDLVKVQDVKDKVFSIAKYDLPSKPNLDTIFGMQEGLNNRFINCLKTSNSYDELIEQVSTKRYSKSTLNRALLNALLDNTFTFNEVIDYFPDYLNVLAIKDSAKDLLSIIEIDLVTKPGELAKLEETKHVHSALDKRASQLFKSLYYQYDNYMQIIK